MVCDKARQFAAYVRKNPVLQGEIAVIFCRIAESSIVPHEAFERISGLAAEEGFILTSEEIAELCAAEKFDPRDNGVLEVEELDEVIAGHAVMTLQHITNRRFFEEI